MSRSLDDIVTAELWVSESGAWSELYGNNDRGGKSMLLVERETGVTVALNPANGCQV